MPVLKAPAVAPSVRAIQGWTGFYAGGHVGYGWGDKIFVDNFPTFDGEIDARPRVRGGLGGLQAGYNYQTGWLVFGVEADFSWSDVKNNEFSCFFFGDQLCSARPEWFGTVSGRIGAGSGPWLLYLKGGAAFTHDEYGNIATCAGSQPIVRAGITAQCGVTFAGTETRRGWLAGAGVEYKFAPNWSVKLEYNYMDFGHRSVEFTDGDTGFFTERIYQKTQTVKAGINYHFGWGATTPVRSGGLVLKADSSEPAEHVYAFSVFDTSKYSYGGVVGAFIAPNKGLDTSGLRVLIAGEAGAYKYPADGGFIRGHYSGGETLVGYAFEGDNYSINLLAGANAVNHTISDFDPANSVQGTAFGVKARGDAWVNPTAKTMVFGEAEYSTAFKSYYASAKTGYDITTDKQLFVGPMVAVMGNERFNQWRVGAHISQLELGKRLKVDISAGYANDSAVGSGAFGNLQFSTAF